MVRTAISKIADISSILIAGDKKPEVMNFRFCFFLIYVFNK